MKQQIGDIKEWATRSLHVGLEKVINMKQNRRTPYFILVRFDNGYNGPAMANDGRPTKTVDLSGLKVLTQRLVVMEKHQLPSVPLLNSCLWRIDNKIGEARCIYILPPDKPLVNGPELEEASKLVFDCSVNMPLVWN